MKANNCERNCGAGRYRENSRDKRKEVRVRKGKGSKLWRKRLNQWKETEDLEFYKVSKRCGRK